MILIITEAVDPHADRVAQKLLEHGADIVRVNPSHFPTLTSVSLSYGAAGQCQGTLRIGNQTIDLHLLDAIWCRRIPRCVAHEHITDEVSRVYLEEECMRYLEGVWGVLECRWVPASPSVIERAGAKASQLKLAGALGFELPPTLFTNDPDEFLQFYRQHNGNIVSKAAGKAFVRSLGETFGRYTQVVSKRDIGYVQAVRFCPMIFQAYVPKLIELRITVVGESVFAAEIHSQVSNHTRHDWRHNDWSQPLYFPHTLPSALEQRCVQLVKRLDLCYGAIDMVLTPDRRYVFLEINPAGRYLWIEQVAGLPISEAICDLLLSRSPAHA
jgi:hypothetical protein